jgi:hypothetical protein
MATAAIGSTRLSQRITLHYGKLPLMRSATFLLCGLFLASPALGNLYVSTTGSDSNSGRSEATAFRTIARAQSEIRQRHAAGDMSESTVEILGGDYPLTAPIDFTKADSGTADRPVIYRAYQNQPVRLLGMRSIDLSQFKPVDDSQMRARLDPSAREKVVWVSTAALGLTHAGPFPQSFSDGGGLFEVFGNDKRLPLARWPKQGWTTMKRVLVNGDSKTPGTFEYRDEEPARWLNNPDLWLKGQWRVPWEDPALRVARIDTAAHTMTFAVGFAPGLGNKYKRPAGNGKEPWYAMNMPEEITAPGEWAVDFSGHHLLIYPPADARSIEVSQLDQPLITGSDVSHLQIVGLTLDGGLDDGIRMQGVDSVLVAGCTIRNVAKTAVVLNGMRSGIQSCDMFDIGAGCIIITGGDKQTLKSSDNFVINNHMHDYAVLKAMYSAAVDMGFGAEGSKTPSSVGCHVAHNLIHDAPRDAILVTGQNHVFELNDIYHCGFGSGDVGSFYSALDWTIRGITIRNNYIHDTVGGVNPDDGASGDQIEGNIFAGPKTGVWIASGPDNHTRFNIFVKDVGPVWGVDDRGISRKYATNPHLNGGLQAIHPDSPPWADAFPQVAHLLENHPELPQDVSFENNLVVIQSGDTVALHMGKPRQSMAKVEGNFTTAEDPGFVDVAHGNLALKPDSAVFQKIPGFKPIPFDQIGLQLDQYRRTLPTEQETQEPHTNPMTEHTADAKFST